MQVDTPSSDALSPAAIDVDSVTMGSVLIASNASAIMSSTVQVQGTKRQEYVLMLAETIHADLDENLPDSVDDNDNSDNDNDNDDVGIDEDNNDDDEAARGW